MKIDIRIYIFLFIIMFSLLPVMACNQEEEPVEIASCSLEQVIETAQNRSPECRLQVPGVRTKG
jgi:hypothetical protein